MGAPSSGGGASSITPGGGGNKRSFDDDDDDDGKCGHHIFGSQISFQWQHFILWRRAPLSTLSFSNLKC